LDAKRWLEAEMRNAGLKVWSDFAGNIFGGFPIDAFPSDHLVVNQGVVMTGSHIDTVPQGGMFDGALGVIAGLECLQSIAAHGISLERPVVVASWTDEEGYYGSLFGSRAFSGRLDASRIGTMAAPDGERLIDAMARAGLDAARSVDAKAPDGSVKAYLELHIEQGPYLERAQVPIGVVNGIVGVRRSRLIFEGRADHAGTMPMDERQDAFMAAADYALQAGKLLKIRGSLHSVMNIGNVLVQPGAANVVPSRVELIHEFRDPELSVLDDLSQGFVHISHAVASQYRVRSTFTQQSTSFPVQCSSRICAITEEVAAAAGMPTQRLFSAAGHDVLNLATMTEVGMIFIPSKGGRSHCPEESTDWEDIERGANVLLQTVIRLAT
jgi:N-carbamoyl-L-amino-acid hydrolase